jgi:hypothetical protein
MGGDVGAMFMVLLVFLGGMLVAGISREDGWWHSPSPKNGYGEHVSKVHKNGWRRTSSPKPDLGEGE